MAVGEYNATILMKCYIEIVNFALISFIFVLKMHNEILYNEANKSRGCSDDNRQKSICRISQSQIYP
uniref:Uncharacterized protein n=1 Tax=uncultured Bacillota bacterium TaxID=344338 RepID=A0A650EN15_9FIRM|nr:hypothetical protein Firmicute1046_3230 [uncultured Firmicutes bacterium]